MSRKVNNLRKRQWSLEQQLAAKQKAIAIAQREAESLAKKLKESKRNECPPITRAVLIDVEAESHMRGYCGGDVYGIRMTFCPDHFARSIYKNSREFHNISQEAYYIGQQIGRQVAEKIMEKLCPTTATQFR